jgi:hypothetical protein
MTGWRPTAAPALLGAWLWVAWGSWAWAWAWAWAWVSILAWGVAAAPGATRLTPCTTRPPSPVGEGFRAVGVAGAWCLGPGSMALARTPTPLPWALVAFPLGLTSAPCYWQPQSPSPPRVQGVGVGVAAAVALRTPIPASPCRWWAPALAPAPALALALGALGSEPCRGALGDCSSYSTSTNSSTNSSSNTSTNSSSCTTT